MFCFSTRTDIVYNIHYIYILLNKFHLVASHDTQLSFNWPQGLPCQPGNFARKRIDLGGFIVHLNAFKQ